MEDTDKALPELQLLVVLSLGRSGSTFFAKALSENSDYVNCGENRFFWQELVKKSREKHPVEIARFFSRKAGYAGKIIDKTPELYRLIDKINFGHYRVDWIELTRSPEAISKSRNSFVTTLRKPKRWMMRVRRYRQDYGACWFLPILQRWYLVPAMLGIGRNRAFVTGGGECGVAQERATFDETVARLRKTTPVTTVDYDDFERTICRLEALGFDPKQVRSIADTYQRRS